MARGVRLAATDCMFGRYLESYARIASWEYMKVLEQEGAAAGGHGMWGSRRQFVGVSVSCSRWSRRSAADRVDSMTVSDW